MGVLREEGDHVDTGMCEICWYVFPYSSCDLQMRSCLPGFDRVCSCVECVCVWFVLCVGV